MRETFIAAFLGATLGLVTIALIRITIIEPLVKRGAAWIGKQNIPEAVKECECCVCGHTHKVAVNPDDGTTIGPIP